MSIARPLLVLSLALAAPARAQISEAAAAAELKAAATANLAQLKAELKAAVAGLDAVLDDFEAAIPGDGGSLAALGDLFTALQDFQGEVVSALEAAGMATDIRCCELLGELQGEGDLQGRYPRDLVPNGGGALERFRTQADKAVATACLAVDKRLRSTVAKLAKKDGVDLCVLLRPPAQVRDNVISPESVLEPASRPMSIDIVVAASAQDVLGDGVLIFGGAADLSLSDVTAGWQETEAAFPTLVIADAGGHGWSCTAPAPLPEGQYTLSASQGTDGALVTASVGMR